MLSLKILLRQKYFLSCFTTTLLIALTTQSSLAFSINPLGPVGAIENWDPDESYTLADGRRGTTTLNPTTVRSITRGGTAGFLAKLRRDFSTWTFNSAPNDLVGSFNVRTYDAEGKISPDAYVGANLLLEYVPGFGDPLPFVGGSLHWIQRVVNNHSTITKQHGDNADIIDVTLGVDTPFYDTLTPAEIIAGRLPFDGVFSDFTTRPDPDQDHDWSAELYLVRETSPRQVTIYNGVQWGWKNRVESGTESVPEPLTMLGAAAALGYGVILKRKSSKK